MVISMKLVAKGPINNIPFIQENAFENVVW